MPITPKNAGAKIWCHYGQTSKQLGINVRCLLQHTATQDSVSPSSVFKTPTVAHYLTDKEGLC